MTVTAVTPAMMRNPQTTFIGSRGPSHLRGRPDNLQPRQRCEFDNKKISSYCELRCRDANLEPFCLSRPRSSTLALSLLRSGQATFHGFGLAQTMREQSGSRSLTAHGTLYKALGRLEEFGLLASRWEDAAAVEGRPRRRLYELTGQGAQVAEHALADKRQGRGRSPRVASEPA